MRTVSCWLLTGISALMAATLGAAANAAEEEAYQLRLNWDKGRTIAYQFTIRSQLTAQSVTTSTTLEFTVTLKVEEVIVSDSVLVPDKRMKVAFTYGDVKLTQEAAQPTLTVDISAKELKPFVKNGRPMEGEQLKTLAKSLAPLQALLAATPQMHLLDTGKIEEVTGLEPIAERQRESLISNLKASFALPRRTLRVGDTFTDRRSLGAVLPWFAAASPEGEKEEDPGDTIEILRTLTSVTSDPESGRSIPTRIAVLSGALHWSSKGQEKEQEKGKDKENAGAFSRLSWEGHAIDADVVLEYETGFDIDRGVHTYDTVTGVITLKAKDLNIGQVVVRVNYRMELIRYE